MSTGWDFAAIGAHQSREGEIGADGEELDSLSWMDDEDYDGTPDFTLRQDYNPQTDFSSNQSATSYPFRFTSPPEHANSHQRQPELSLPNIARQEPANSSNPVLIENLNAYIFDYSSIASQDNQDSMPSARRPRQTRASIVDLTDSPAVSGSHQTTPNKRAAGDEGASAPPLKRNKGGPVSPLQAEEEDAVDEAPSAEDELLKAQQIDALKAQEDRRDMPQKIGRQTCIICLENYTNATTAICGHIFCHECLTRALIASEKNSDRGIGNCPACRKPISRKKAHQIIPISFMKKSAFKDKGRQPGQIG